VVAEVPFVDVLNTMQDETLPLTPIEWPEWGNPLTSEEDFERIRSWCPYENIAAKAYPAMLVTAGISDPRVTYWEPAKYVAKLRATKTDDHILLLKTNMDAGHFGASGRFDALQEHAEVLTFVLECFDEEAAPATVASNHAGATPA
jgi:oligopeptidase B